MKSRLQEQLGKRIQYLRKIKGYSQELFAEKIDIATNTLSSIERGNAFMTAVTLENIAKELNVEPRELFTFSEIDDNQKKYEYIKKSLEFIKDDELRLQILYNVTKGLY
ncbi:helix-turn-helix transcriptional regulator [bacterium]|nr:helix-turn-helix transcriptional regulator [bacterium]